ncbi:MAG: hypothetical protein M3Q99_09710 [Acidobacteriota bacterium]|nr:hypothetical protein [Acidobacteriota bacterium]
MFAKIGQLVRIGSGWILTLFGALGILVAVIGIIDPVGSKMSDDSDPFGVPHTFTESLAIAIFYVLIFILGISLIFGSKWIREMFSKISLK